jgi:hypothetical protein
MMTSGPAATLGAILHVPFARPRVRKNVLEHPDYYALREKMIGFLESQEHPGQPAPAPDEEPEPPPIPLSQTVLPTK